jgi:hypothetical protein
MFALESVEEKIGSSPRNTCEPCFERHAGHRRAACFQHRHSEDFKSVRQVVSQVVSQAQEDSQLVGLFTSRVRVRPAAK